MVAERRVAPNLINDDRFQTLTDLMTDGGLNLQLIARLEPEREFVF